MPDLRPDAAGGSGERPDEVSVPVSSDGDSEVETGEDPGTAVSQAMND